MTNTMCVTTFAGTSAAELLAEVREHVSMGNAEAAEASIESLWQLVFAKDEATVRWAGTSYRCSSCLADAHPCAWWRDGSPYGMHSTGLCS